MHCGAIGCFFCKTGILKINVPVNEIDLYVVVL